MIGQAGDCGSRSGSSGEGGIEGIGGEGDIEGIGGEGGGALVGGTDGAGSGLERDCFVAERVLRALHQTPG